MGTNQLLSWRVITGLSMKSRPLSVPEISKGLIRDVRLTRDSMHTPPPPNVGTTLSVTKTICDSPLNYGEVRIGQTFLQEEILYLTWLVLATKGRKCVQYFWMLVRTSHTKTHRERKEIQRLIYRFEYKDGGNLVTNLMTSGTSYSPL